MPYRLHWLVPEQIIFCDIYDLLLPSEQLVYSQSVNAMCAQVTGYVHIIVDVRALREWPSIPGVMRMASQYPLPKNVDRVVSVGRFTQPNIFLAKIFGQFFGIQLHVVAEMQEALEYLRENLPALNWDAADYGVLERPEP